MAFFGPARHRRVLTSIRPEDTAALTPHGRWRVHRSVAQNLVSVSVFRGLAVGTTSLSVGCFVCTLALFVLNDYPGGLALILLCVMLTSALHVLSARLIGLRLAVIGRRMPIQVWDLQGSEGASGTLAMFCPFVIELVCSSDQQLGAMVAQNTAFRDGYHHASEPAWEHSSCALKTHS